ncbi:uncharacterized protein LOC114945887 [Nylanderia fulva]|uniref:uncharacterized protein LOC114945887 n=1 Tax=Nylanderia fulva TaxID=613905 RepID=UPI0010FB6660|nr:uncharacterized protein LOC114945887 [Nylanderia fulva]
MDKSNKPKCVKREKHIKNKNEIENNPRGKLTNDPREELEKEPIKEIENVLQEELENDNGEEDENDSIPELDSKELSELNHIDTDPENEPGNEPENNLRIKVKAISSFNSITLEDVRDILYELHEYFDEFQIEIVACPDLTREPYNLKKSGMSGDTTILEVYTPNYSERMMLSDMHQILDIKAGKNYFLSKRKPGMVLKIRAKGRKITNYNIITLIQNILHKRLWYKIGLGGLLLIQGGFIKLGKFTKDGMLWCHDVDCNSNTNVCHGVIVNDPVIIEGKHNGFFYTNDRYMFRSSFEFHCDRFLNDITPEETEYVGYFDIGKRMFYIY